MKAMIFAAGLGTRLKPFTDSHPKALVEVNGIPMLQRVLENLRSADVSKVVVNVHHFASQITEFLSANGNFGMDIEISDESDMLLDTGGGLLKARQLLLAANPEEPILLHNADILTDLDIRQMLRYHLDNNNDATLLCSSRESSRTLWFDNADQSLLGWENRKSGEFKPAGFSPAEGMSASPFNGVHIISPGRLFPELERFAPSPLAPFSIIPFYLSAINSLAIRRYSMPPGTKWFDVGSNEKLAAAEAGF